MKQKYISIVFLSVLINAGLFGQTPPFLQLDGGKNHYRHSYNKDYPTTIDSPREDRDSVMVGATLHYFSIPDLDFNADYKDSVDIGNYLATDDTKSVFTWTVPPSIGSFAAYVKGNAQAGNTSPHITITWNAAGADTVRMVETPTEYQGKAFPASMTVCPGAEAKIPVTVIPQPNVQFDGNEDGSCVPNAAAGVSIALPLLPISGNISYAAGVEIVYTLSKDGVAQGGNLTASFASLGATGALSLTVTDYGVYVITIVSITDRISRKCGITVNAAVNNTFTYVLTPQPKAGETYHYPNNY